METIDTSVLGGRVAVKQPKEGGLRVTMDTIFVAAACPAEVGDHVADIGAGTGAAGLCVAARVGQIGLTFVEVQQDFTDLALKNARLNNIEVDSVCEDIRTHEGWYDHIVCNPPYLDEGTYWVSPDPKRQKALGATKGDATLEDWVAASARCLKEKGSFSMIHRADSLDKILVYLNAYRFGAIEIWPLQPYEDKDAHRVVVRALLGRKTKMILHPAIVLHTGVEGEKYSARAEGVLSEMSSL